MQGGVERAVIRVEIPFSITMTSKAVMILPDTQASDLVAKALRFLSDVYDPSVYALFLKTSAGARRLPDDEIVFALAKRNREAAFLIGNKE